MDEPKENKKQSNDELVKSLLAQVEELKKKDAEKDEKLKMLYEVADKGRIFNYEASRTQKQPMKVKLSVYQGGIIVGWATLKDELIKHPGTGRTIGEEQQYEVLVLDKDGKTSKHAINGYPAFTDARYNTRIEAEVTGKKESYDGKITFSVSLPDGRTVDLDSRFVN